MLKRLIIPVAAILAFSCIYAQEVPAEAQPAQPQKTYTKEEINELVKSMVKEELAKAEAEKAAITEKERKEKAEKEKALEAEKARKTADKKEDNGLISADFQRNALTFILGDDNLRDNSQYSPATDIGPRTDDPDFMNRFTGYNYSQRGLARMTLFHRQDGLLSHLTTAIGLAFDLQLNPDSTKFVSPAFAEGGSFLEVGYSDSFTLKLTLYPYNADAIAVGYFPGIKWGRREAFPENQGTVPGAQILFGYGPFSVYAGMKAHAQPLKDKLSTEMVPKETVYGGFGGLTLNYSGLKLNLQGGFIDKGDNPYIQDSSIKNRKDDEILAYGIDFFGQYEFNKYIGEPLGIFEYADGGWKMPDYTGDWALRGRVEGIFQNERLQNSDYLVANDGTAKGGDITGNLYAGAAAVEISARYQKLRLFGMFSYRSLSFLVFDAPGLDSYSTLPKDADVNGEFAGTLSVDYNWSILWFGFSMGIKKPATYKAPGSDVTTVVKERLDYSSTTTAFSQTRVTLPSGKDALNMAYYKLHIKAQFSESLSGNIEFGFAQDANKAKVVQGTDSNYYDWEEKKVQDMLSLFLSFEGRF